MSDHRASTQAIRAAEALQRAILAGRLAPESRLHVEALASEHAVGITPMREALSRLVATGFVSSVGQRGFRVAGASLDDLEDITRLRVLVETEALRLSLASGDTGWAQRLRSALEELTDEVARGQDGFGEGDESLDRTHKAFHGALISACGSPRMLALCGALYDQAYRYRRLGLAQGGALPADFGAEHEQLARLALARDIEGCCERLAAHLYLTLGRARASTARPAAPPIRSGRPGGR